MIDAGRSLLRQLLVASYDDLKRRLTRRLGDPDTAAEVLHETWLRLDGISAIGLIRRPHSYLYRMALNVAADQRRANARWLSQTEIEALIRVDAEQLDPERIAAADSEIAALERTLAELPPLRRAIFMAALVEGLPYRLIAARHGISLRTVEREMKRAFDDCIARSAIDLEPGARRRS